MHALYERTDGNPLDFVESWGLGAEFKWSHDETDAITNYLNEEGLLHFPVFGTQVSITHAGVVELERSREKPDAPTEHFAPFNVIVIGGDVTGGQIMNASPAASQSQSWASSAVEAAVRETRAAMIGSDLAAVDRQALETRLNAVQAELALPEPAEGVVRESLRSVRAIGENLVANGIWASLPVALAALPL